MELIVQLLIALAPFMVLAVLAWHFGAESRPGFDENRRREAVRSWW